MGKGFVPYIIEENRRFERDLMREIMKRRKQDLKFLRQQEAKDRAKMEAIDRMLEEEQRRKEAECEKENLEQKLRTEIAQEYRLRYALILKSKSEKGREFCAYHCPHRQFHMHEIMKMLNIKP